METIEKEEPTKTVCTQMNNGFSKLLVSVQCLQASRGGGCGGGQARCMSEAILASLGQQLCPNLIIIPSYGRHML